jgi:hypothetical protein
VAGLSERFSLSSLSIGASALCAVHCAALPLLAGASALEHSVIHHPLMEVALIGSAAVIGYGTLGISFRRHGRIAPLLILTAGLAAMIYAHVVLGEGTGTPVAVGGALALIGAQVVNRFCPAPCCAPGGCHSSQESRASEAASA